MTTGTAQRWKDGVTALAFVVTYVVFDRLSYIYPVAPLGITPWNPPPGLSLFLLLRYGLRFWPCVFVGALGADLLVRGLPIHWFNSILSAAAISAGYWLAAWLLLQKLRLRTTLDSARDLWMFLLVLVPCALLVSLAYVVIYTVAGAVVVADFWDHVTKFWIGDLNGLFVLTPALLVHLGSRPSRPRLNASEWFEIGGQALALLAALWLIFVLGEQYEFRLFYPLFLPLVWIASRWGLKGATLALAAIQLGLIAAVQIGGYHAASFVQLQALMLILCVTGLVLGAAVAQRSLVEAQLRERQGALNQAMRQASAGEMSSAIAHELNQPMAALSAYLGACQKLLQAPGDQRALLDETLGKAIVQARRASEVVHVLREFFKTGTQRRQHVQAQDLLAHALDTVRPRCERDGIRLQVDAAAALPALHVDALQIETALHNLLANAADALQSVEAGHRLIRVRLEPAAGGVRFDIEDSGPGIAPTVRPQLFEPFNSSKEEGMGLGLAISKTLVEAHGGSLSTVELPGRGARFSLTLPRAGAAA